MIRQRDFLVRHRHRLALLAVLGVIALAVTVEHAGVGYAGMTDMDEGAGDAVAMCLAVVATSVAALAAAGAAGAVGSNSAPFAFVATAHMAPRRTITAVPARAGPQELQVFRR